MTFRSSTIDGEVMFLHAGDNTDEVKESAEIIDVTSAVKEEPVHIVEFNQPLTREKEQRPIPMGDDLMTIKSEYDDKRSNMEIAGEPVCQKELIQNRVPDVICLDTEMSKEESCLGEVGVALDTEMTVTVASILTEIQTQMQIPIGTLTATLTSTPTAIEAAIVTPTTTGTNTLSITPIQTAAPEEHVCLSDPALDPQDDHGDCIPTSNQPNF